MRAAQWRSGHQDTGKGDGCKVELLYGMGGCVATAENHATHTGLLDKLAQQAPESSTKALVVSRPRWFAERRVKNRIAA